ncbi:MAG TPA: hypothetical protein VN616_02250 [Puia sp.]|nr:hypothetical protein [Puia sp.]
MKKKTHAKMKERPEPGANKAIRSEQEALPGNDGRSLGSAGAFDGTEESRDEEDSDEDDDDLAREHAR